MSGAEPREPARVDAVEQLQAEVRSLVEQGLSAEQIEAGLEVPPAGRSALAVIVRYEVARAALEGARERLSSMLAAGVGNDRAPVPKRRKVLGAEEPGHVDYGARREAVMAQARIRARQLAEEGLSATEIQGRLDYRLTDTERELMTPIIRQEVVAARRARVARTMDAKGEHRLSSDS
jgi:hypothetical protein